MKINNFYRPEGKRGEHRNASGFLPSGNEEQITSFYTGDNFFPSFNIQLNKKQEENKHGNIKRYCKGLCSKAN